MPPITLTTCLLGYVPEFGGLNSAQLRSHHARPSAAVSAEAAPMATRNPSLNIVPSLKRNQTDFERAAADAELMGARGDWWWTGLKPSCCPGFDEAAGVLR